MDSHNLYKTEVELMMYHNNHFNNSQMENTTVQNTAVANVKSTLIEMKREKGFTERVINDPVFGFEAKMFKEEALREAILQGQVEAVVTTELNILSNAMDRAGITGELFTIVSIVQTLIDDGHKDKLYNVIKLNFPEYFY